MNRDQILEAIKNATGDPTTGPVAEITPAIADAIQQLANPTTRTKNKTETRLMTPTGEQR